MHLVLDFVFVGGILLIAFIIFLLSKSRNKQLSQRILIVFFSFTLCVSIFFYARLHGIKWLSAITFIPNDVTSWYIGPLLYLYVKSLFLNEQNLIRNNWKHFIPAIAYTLSFTIPAFLLDWMNLKSFSFVNAHFWQYVLTLEDVYLVVYLILSIRFIYRAKHMVKSNYSNVEEYNFNWVKIMLVGALIIISFDLCLKVYDDITNNLNWELQYFVIAAMVLLISYLGYYGVNQPKVVLPNFLVLEEGTVSANASNNSTTLSNNEAEFKLLRDKLEHILKQFKPHLDEDLTLGKLAHQIPTTDKKLSMLLNQHMNTSFYDLINKYRVEEIKERIKSNTYEKYTLFGIACECGFKSRTSFNRIFKQETGLSPSEYKKKHL